MCNNAKPQDNKPHNTPISKPFDEHEVSKASPSFFKMFFDWLRTGYGFTVSFILVLAFILSLLVNLADFVEGKENLCQISDIFWWCGKDDDSPVEQAQLGPMMQRIPNEKTVEPFIQTTAQLAIDLFVGQNPASLQITILPSAALKIGEIMQLQFSSEHDGYLLVFDINSKGALTQLFPNTYSQQEQYGYLKAGQILTIPDIFYPFEFEVQEPTGKSILLAILIEDALAWYSHFSFAFETKPAKDAQSILRLLREQLNQTVQDEKGVNRSIHYSAEVAHYDVVP